MKDETKQEKFYKLWDLISDALNPPEDIESTDSVDSVNGVNGINDEDIAKGKCVPSSVGAFSFNLDGWYPKVEDLEAVDFENNFDKYAPFLIFLAEQMTPPKVKDNPELLEKYNQSKAIIADLVNI